MKTLFLMLIALFLIVSDVNAQAPDTLVIEFQAKVGNTFSIQGLLALRNKEQSDFDEDGVPELVLFERDDLGNTVGLVALDGRTRTTKWEFDLMNIETTGGSLNKMSTGINEDRLAIMSGEKGGVLAVNPVTNKALLHLADDFVLLAVIDIDADEKEELIIVNKKTRQVFIVGDGTVE